MSFNQELKNSAYILSGSIFLAVGIVLFLAPNKIATGGTPGMAILLHYVIDLPIGMLMIAINVPLLLIGLRFLGKLFALRTVVAIVLSSLAVDFFAEYLKLEVLLFEL